MLIYLVRSFPDVVHSEQNTMVPLLYVSPGRNDHFDQALILISPFRILYGILYNTAGRKIRTIAGLWRMRIGAWLQSITSTFKLKNNLGYFIHYGIRCVLQTASCFCIAIELYSYQPSDSSRLDSHSILCLHFKHTVPSTGTFQPQGMSIAKGPPDFFCPSPRFFFPSWNNRRKTSRVIQIELICLIRATGFGPQYLHF